MYNKLFIICWLQLWRLLIWWWHIVWQASSIIRYLLVSWRWWCGNLHNAVLWLAGIWIFWSVFKVMNKLLKAIWIVWIFSDWMEIFRTKNNQFICRKPFKNVLKLYRSLCHHFPANISKAWHSQSKKRCDE